MADAQRVLGALRSLRSLNPDELDAVRSLLNGDSSPLADLGIEPEATLPHDGDAAQPDAAAARESTVEDEPHPSRGAEQSLGWGFHVTEGDPPSGEGYHPGEPGEPS